MLFLGQLFLPNTLAYTSDATITRINKSTTTLSPVPITTPLPQPHEILPWGTDIQRGSKTKTKTRLNPSSYSLGTGKNQPIVGGRKSRHHVSNQHQYYQMNDSKLNQDATRYLTEYESVRPYPSPLDSIKQNDQQQTTKQQSEKKTKKVLPVVQLKRQSQDSLEILDTSSASEYDHKSPSEPVQHYVPTIMAKAGQRQLDLNTVWVEMLIHSEQLKGALVSAAATA